MRRTGIQFAELLDEIILYATERLDDIGDQDFNLKVSEEKWSKKEVLGHLIDSAINNHRRFIVATTKNDLIFDGYDQDLWVRMNNYQSRDVEDIIETWSSMNFNIFVLLEGLTDEQLHRTTTEHRFHKMAMRPVAYEASSSLGFLIEDYLYHMEYHLSAIIDDYEFVGDYD